MSSVLPPRRTIVLKASRDTLVLTVAAGAMTLAIAYSVHTRPAPATLQGQNGGTAEQAAAGEWAGQLADLSSNQGTLTTPTERMSTATLTVDKAAMALPAAPRPVPALSTKPRTCDGSPCLPSTKAATTGSTTIAVAPALGVATTSLRRAPAVAAARQASLVEKLNPLNHLPEMVKRPFASAGDTIAGWVKLF